jgi:hypothetical protein
MARYEVTASTAVAVSLLAAIALSWAVPATAAPVKAEGEACAAVKARVSARGHFQIFEGTFCDVIPAAHGPNGYYILALHGPPRPDCGAICSTSMGWFAVQKATGRVFEWNVAEWNLGRAING